MEQRFAEAVLRFRWVIIPLVLIVCLLSAYGAQFIEISTEPRDNFGPDNPQLLAFQDLEETFSRVENLFFVIHPKTGDIFTRETLAVIEETWRTSFVNRVDSITNYQHTETEDDDLIVSNLVEFPHDLTDSELLRIKEIALNEPMILNRLVSLDGTVTGINVDLNFDSDPQGQIPKAHWAWDKKAQIMRDHPNLEVYVTGSLIISSTFSEVAVRDLKLQTPLMYLFVIITMFLLLRAVGGVVGIVVTTFLTILAGMGAAGWIGMTLTSMSAQIPVIILTVVVAHGIHLMVTYYQNLREGQEKYTSMINAISINIQPVALTSLSTAIGFFSLNLLADVPPIQQVGNVVGATVCIALVTSLTFLPALVYVLPNRVGPQKTFSTEVMSRFAEFVILHQRKLLLICSPVAIVLLLLAPLNEVSDQFSKYFSESMPLRTDTDFTDENLGGLYSIEYSLETGRPQGISDPKYLKVIEDFAIWYRQQEHVTHVRSYTDTVKRLNQTLHTMTSHITPCQTLKI